VAHSVAVSASGFSTRRGAAAIGAATDVLATAFTSRFGDVALAVLSETLAEGVGFHPVHKASVTDLTTTNNPEGTEAPFAVAFGRDSEVPVLAVDEHGMVEATGRDRGRVRVTGGDS
jgi:hypothetical protein